MVSSNSTNLRALEGVLLQVLESVELQPSDLRRLATVLGEKTLQQILAQLRISAPQANTEGAKKETIPAHAARH